MKRKLTKHSGGISEIFVSDVFSFSSQKRLRTMLIHICLAFIIGTVLLAVTSYFMEWSNSAVIAMLTALGLVVVLLVSIAGHTRVATVALLLLIYSATALGVSMANGLHDMTILIFPLIIVIGSLTLKLPFFILLVALIVNFFIVIGLQEIARGEAFIYPVKDLGGDIVIITIIIIAEALIMRSLANVISGALTKAYKSEQDYKEIFNAAQSAIFIHDFETGKILDVNDVTLDTYGYTYDEMLGMFAGDITGLHDECSQEIAHKYIIAARDEGPQLFEWLALRKDGSEFWTEVMLKLTEIGGAGHILAVVRDIDARKKLESRLRQGEKMEAVGLLAGGIAHDFNNQLTGIIGYAELSLGSLGKEQQEIRDNLNGIMLSADRSAELIAQLLAFARKAKYQSAPVDIHELVNEVVSLLGRSIDKTIEIECEFKAKESMVIGDSAQLQNAILNLAINARDAMPEGGLIIFATENITVTKEDLVFMSEEVVLGKHVRLTVTDTGVGMTKDVKDRIFEPFFTTKAAGKGTGMGLSAVYGTIKNHGGNVSVYSENGHGASFIICLPLAEDAGETVDLPQVEKDISLLGKRILVVDDEDVVCQMVERMVAQCEGISVICNDGSEAIEYYQQFHNIVDVVILDMIMPNIGGAETFYELCKINPEVAVVITSGFSLNDNVQGLLDTGAKGFVQKPFRREDLCHALASACK